MTTLMQCTHARLRGSKAKEEFSLQLMEECRSAEVFWRRSNLNICFGLASSESLHFAGGDHFEGLNPHCNGILICGIVHCHT